MTVMRRRGLLAFTLGVCLSMLPAHAAQSINQVIILPTYGSPALARIAYQNGENGVLGYVFRVDPATNWFTLHNPDTSVTASDFDIVFYRAIDSLTATPMDPQYLDSGPKSGPIPAGAVYGVITSSTGAQQTFVYTGYKKT
ncbi:MAG: hypothetical protein ACYDCC_09520 [Actinomycetota bacterium]